MLKYCSYKSFDEKAKYYNSDTWKIIKTSVELDNAINELNELKKSQKTHTLFRGVSEAKFKLYTSLQRECFLRDIDTTKNPPRSIVSKLIEESKPNHRENIMSNFRKLGIPVNDWLILAMLQHYGAPSPLLDFTKDFIPALYFMCKNLNVNYDDSEIDNYFSIVYFKVVDACSAGILENLPKTGLNIFKKKGIKLNDYRAKENFVLSDLSFNKVMSDRMLELIPSYNGVTTVKYSNHHWIVNIPVSNMNMASQEGEFVCNISPDKPLEDFFIQGNVRFLNCINIHKRLFHYIVQKHLRNSLDEMGSLLFPSEYNVVDDIYARTLSSLF